MMTNIKGGMWIQSGRPRQPCAMNVMEVAEMAALAERRRNQGW